ncbi:acyl transferase/acyl hydrolase/lysophospholipase [Dissophora ornata]|nr:acyl transferase/acyl hydrolase/lysophospholipase [Dissophora ornata]
MGKDLYDTYAVARQVVDEADEALGGKLKHVMFEGSQEDLTRTENAQPAILTTSIAKLRVLESERGFKIEESCKNALGHSLGEYSALVATKALALQDAVKLVRLRGEAMTKAVTNKGTTAMSALVVRPAQLDALVETMDEIKATLPSGELAEISNINSSFQVVISGTVRGVDHASRVLQGKKIAARAVDLPVSAPFHCSLMQPAADAMKEALKDVKFQKPIINVISNVTAKPITNVEDISDLLVKQVTRTVQWHASIKYLRDQENVHDYLSLGPGKVLANLLRKEYPLDFVKTVTTAEDIQQWTL